MPGAAASSPFAIMMGSDNHDFFPGALRGDMLFSEAYYRQSGRIFDDQLFPNAVLPETAGPGTACSADGPVLPPSAGYINWVNEAEDMKQRASFAVNSRGAGLVMPAWGDEQGAVAMADGSLDGLSPDWWCQEQQRQHDLCLQEQAAVSWNAFGQADVSSCMPWPVCDVDGAADMLAVPSAAAQPLALHEAAYPPLLDDLELGLDPYPEMKVGPFATPTKHWPDSPPSYIFPHAVENTTPFLLSEASSPSSDASLSNVSEESDLEARFTSTLSLSAPVGNAPSSSDRVLRSASFSPAWSFPGRKGKTAVQARAATAKARASRSRRRLPSIAPELPPLVGNTASRTRRTIRLSCKKAGKRSRAPSASHSEQARGCEGPPYDKIDDMDPVNKNLLETTLLRDRDSLRSKKVPYSIIQAKLRHLYSGAEETLRGHHRRLVLPKEQRVRKPVWLPRDDALLQQAVRLQRIACPRAKKVAWTSISRYIQDHGGSYRFGVTTCSRRYRALQGGDVA